MKKYFKPRIKFDKIVITESISSLNDWLQQNEYTDAGITTYVINS